jgi:hypothetical protein
VQKDGAEEHQEVVAVTNARPGPVAVQAPGQRGTNRSLLCPFDLQVWAVDRMLNLEIRDHPVYEGLELQVFDDPAHGRGMIVLLRRRRDGRFDIYRQPGLTLDPELAQVGGELGAWAEADIDPARFDISQDGVDVDVRLADLAGRVVQVRIDDRDGRRRHRGTLLAPVGSVIERPVSLPLFVMGGCDLVRRGGRVFEVRIDGRAVTTGRLPGVWLHRRRLVKYTADPTVVVVNRAHDGSIGTAGTQAPGGVEVAPGATGIAGLRAGGGGHTAHLELEPALPDLTSLASGVRVRGVWRLGVDDDPAVVGGTWTARRVRDRIDLVLDVTRGWRPKGLPPLMAAVTRVAPVFRRWPTTYRWTATVTLGNEPALRSRWERKGDRRDQSYRRLTT